ncbi:choice-of-anchor L domain-containing protein [Aquimarina sp. AD10]|uniref:choice-of-anchor L domain-containing protein n=1 Tax=Aquimarina sp. AD10 TaxID=1714849 RepID=UPI000EA93BE9|nr:choice-of-anchor L domain-containing protein [Aquimarina sp. AD10]RKM96235.1 hypothetical protein D7033_16110 [Aquimarina sp. AD10]
MKKITLITFFIVLLFNGKEVLSQATFTANPTDVALTTQLGGTGITISNPTLENGSRFFQLATFSNGNAGASLSIDTGVLMTTGTATQAFGSNGTAAFPSNSGVAATEQVQPTTYNDPDIIAIDPNANFDVVVFSFDVVLDPRLTALQIVYQFGSDEYPDYVGTVFNDVFGFFVSGPGITGSQNLALVPGTSNPVAVNSVNGGFLGCNNANAGIAAPADLSQSALFINNGFDTATPPGPPATCNTNSGAFPIFTEYNGITNQFTGTINGLTAGVTYRFKIAIADTGDRSLDSAVFINQIIGTNDIDGDGTSDQADLDDDNDGILDTAENTLNVDPSGDADGDFILNYEDFDDNGTATAPVCLDADLDGICDTLDPVFDFDGDNVSDHLDLDSDNDGIYDVVEAGGTDDDNDGDADGVPGNTAGTIGIPATAGTGLIPIETTAGTPDHLNLDSDNDGCSDANEAYSDPDADGGDGGQYGITDPATVDGDGLVTETGINYTLGTNTAVTFSSNASTCIDANTDVNSIQVLGSTGGLAIANVLVNDTFGGATATIGTVDITVVSSSDPNVTLNTANGEVNVTPGTAAGIYTIGYQICEAGSAMPCSTSLITIIVDGDYDLDGVGDTTDLDDDNDGILDTVECPAVTGTSVEGPNLVLNSNFDDGYAFWTSDFNRGRGNEDGGTGYPRTSGTCADQGWVAVSPYNSTNGICNTYYTYPNTLPGIPDGSVLIVDADQTGANVYYTGGPVPPGGGNNTGCDANYVPFTDGTPGTLANPNNTLYIDPSDVVGESYWKQTVSNIEANSTYIFRCFIYIVEQNPELAFIINGATIFNSPVGDGSAGQIGTWQEVEFNWNSVAVSGAVTIEIANTQAGCFGNDIRLDDITFAKLFADFDGDGISNCRDIDSDNDGIPDVVEAQPTVGYTALPNNGVVGTSVAANGIPNGFPAIGFTPENTDGTADGPDYLDLNSDDEGDNDTLEAGFTAATNTIDTDGDGLLNQYDASPTDAAGAIDYDDDQNGGSLDLPNVQDPVSTEVDYRDSTLGTDSDNDDVVDFFDLDDDNDGITDVVESGGNAPNGDEDGDGVPNWQDDTDNDPGNTIGDSSTTVYTDSNGDGVPDVYDLDGDGVPNHLDLDSDNDGIYDLVESGQFDNGAVDANGDGVIDGTPVNFGNNGLANSIESDDTFTATTASPTDTDGNVNDGPNYLDIDSDDDGIPDNIEGQPTVGYIAPIVDNPATPLIDESDTDGNGVNDAYDTNGTALDPDAVDIDGTGGGDYIDTDADGDGIPDATEAYDTDGDNVPDTLPANADSDGDGLDDNYDTIDLGTTPATNATDGGELATDFPDDDNVGGDRDWRDPLDADGDDIADNVDLDDDNDGIPDIVESGGNAPNGDEDGDGVPNWQDDTDNDPGNTIGDGSTTVYTDSNGDGVPDVYDFDGDGIPNHLDLDSDNDGLYDVVETGNGALDTDNDGEINGSVGSNGIPDTAEDGGVDGAGVSSAPTDTDGNVNDGPNYLDIDSDDDGIPDNIEGQPTVGYIAPIVDNPATPLIDESDTDGNGVNDAYDTNGTALDPDAVDIDGTGGGDYIDTDADGDGIPDATEAYDTDGDNVPDTLPANADSDGDGLDDNYDTIDLGTTPATNATDGGELATDFPDDDNVGGDRDWRDPLDADGDDIADNVDLDDDNDGIPDIVESGGNAPNGDEDGDGVPNWQDDTDNDPGNTIGDGSTTVYTDSNGDGVPDVYDFDGDGIPNHLDLDSDNDGLYDVVETGNGALDTDNDGEINGSVGSNGIPDTAEDGGVDGAGVSSAPTDTDGNVNDGPNYLDIDSDDDGIPDNIEGQPTVGYIAPIVDNPATPLIDESDTDGNGVNDAYDTNGTALDPDAVDIDGTGGGDYIDTDADGDGVLDVIEANQGTLIGTDTDGDGLDDGFEGGTINDNDANDDLDNGSLDTPDADGDALTGGDVDYRDADDLDNDGIPDSVDLDDDNDGILDTAEDPNLDGDNNPYTEGTPGENDSDNDGIPNFQDIDSDNDGIPDNVEAQSTAGYIQPLVDDPSTFINEADADNDGLNDAYEGSGDVGIIPENTDGVDTPDYIDLDSDQDGVNDTIEAGFDLANDTTDTDGDGLLDDYEGSDPNDGFDPNDELNNGSDDTQNTDTIDEVDYRDLDDDNDGVDTAEEDYDGDNNPTNQDSDGDSIPDYLDIDDDGDGVNTSEENPNPDGDGDPNTGITQDTDNDTIPDYLDTDDDGDNIPTIDENPNADGDGNPDTNGDGIPDAQDTDGNGVPDYLDEDDDGDSVNTVEEDYDGDNDPTDQDTDGDSTPDYLDTDDDNDGIDTINEEPDPNTDGNPDDAVDTDGDTIPDYLDNDDLDNDGISDSLDLDDDNDGILDTAEDPNLDGDNNPYTEGTPGENDSDGDGIPNFQDIDSDNDGIPDNVESQPTVGYVPPSGIDLDMDGLDDAYEGTGDQGITAINTDGIDQPDYIDFDSDNDGVLDATEAGFIEANDIGDADGDGLLDDYEGSDINDGFDTNDELNNGSDDTQNTDTVDEVDYRDIDDDNDGVDTIHEDVNINSNPVDDDTDRDGIPNYLDIDDDGDGVSTIAENPNPDGDGDPMTGVTQDTDGDGIDDYLDIDDDGDNVPTLDENPNPDGDIDPTTGNTQDTDDDGTPDYLDIDDDGDTVNTVEEDYDVNNDPTDTDTDGDGTPDYLDIDDDNDTILTENESPDPNGDGDPEDARDIDGNGTPDYLEPNNIDPDAEDGVIVYTGITPNGDGSNDVFVIQGIENLENTLEIYNRWGVKVYGSKNYGRNNNFFKGISTGRTTVEEKDQLPAGTYYYVLEYVLQSGESKNRAGYLYINR